MPRATPTPPPIQRRFSQRHQRHARTQYLTQPSGATHTQQQQQQQQQQQKPDHQRTAPFARPPARAQPRRAATCTAFLFIFPANACAFFSIHPTLLLFPPCLLRPGHQHQPHSPTSLNINMNPPARDQCMACAADGDDEWRVSFAHHRSPPPLTLVSSSQRPSFLTPAAHGKKETTLFSALSLSLATQPE